MSHLSLERRISILADLANVIARPDDRLLEVIRQAGFKNPWFSESSCRMALDGIWGNFLNKELLKAFADRYHIPPINENIRNVGIVMAGNLPLVGFHDWLCVFLSGHRALIKLSEKDTVLFSHLLERLAGIEPAIAESTRIVDKLAGFDAVIATGSDNSARYFEHYFGKYPHLIRANRNGVAILFGDETVQDLDALCSDITSYFGLGCRNVSHLFIPRGYDLGPLIERLDQHAELEQHDRYRNNYDYQCAILLLNKISFLQGRNILLREDPALISPMACLYFSQYSSMDELLSQLDQQRNAIQCVVSTKEIPGQKILQPGQAQSPGLADFADGVDTIEFLQGLSL